MKAFGALSVFAFVVLGAAAVWMGGLNQDEGWYLYAANLVAEGKVPYRDFFYTQGPLLPFVYSAFTWVWGRWGILGARVFTLLLGALSLLFAVALARRLAPPDRRGTAGLVAFFLLGVNLYHLYFLAIPKTYAQAALFVTMGFFLLSRSGGAGRAAQSVLAAASGLSLALAAGTRISLGLLLATAGLWLLFGRRWRRLVGFTVGGLAGLSLVYLPFLLDPAARSGLVAAQAYHAARGGFDVVWTVGSFSRLVRWYLPVFIVLGLWFGCARRAGSGACGDASFRRLLLGGFLAVFAVQMLAPFPYEDYQVPIMGLLAAAAAAGFATLAGRDAPGQPLDGQPSAPRPRLFSVNAQFLILLVLGLSYACAFGSPLLEKWSTNGQDRFWSLKKESFELPQLRAVAKRIEALDPGGKELLTQDLYLAIETGRKVPAGLEMGPFSVLSDAEWRKLLAYPTAPLAALSGYTFAVEPPACGERPLDQQMEYWSILKRSYEFVERHDAFGQNATPLLILRRK